jgi:hypothetical protein
MYVVRKVMSINTEPITEITPNVLYKCGVNVIFLNVSAFHLLFNTLKN